MAAGNGLLAGPRRSTIRCAVYTRKSTEEGLEQAFNTLDAQRDAAEAFIRSQRGEGWAPLAEGIRRRDRQVRRAHADLQVHGVEQLGLAGGDALDDVFERFRGVDSRDDGRILGHPEGRPRG
jgi:hypothetical protein